MKEPWWYQHAAWSMLCVVDKPMPRAVVSLTTTREALRQSEHRFRLLVESVRDYAIFLLDPNGYISSWNIGAERIKGYSADDILGRHFSTFYPEEDVRAGKCEFELEVAAREGRFEDEGWRIRKDRTRFWANVIITALFDENKTLVGFAKVTRDLTERRRAEEERVRLAQAQEANRLKDEFLATISHELRTPLNAILGWSNLLRERATDPSTLKAAEIIRRNAQAQTRIIEDMLDVSRIITGKLRLEVRPVDFATIVRDAIDVMRPAADARQVMILLERFDQPTLLVGDAVRLQQIVWNLLSNAVKFSDAGGKVSVCLEQDGPLVELSVSDDGRGIEPEFLPHVFERFRQADGTTTRRFGGLGLGLAIVRHLVELHGGTVSAESAGLGRGAKFTINLPVRAVAPGPEAETISEVSAVTRASVPSSARLDGIRILIVDDEPDARDLLEALLSEYGATVHSVGSAASGLLAVEKVQPHVLISDIGMPEQDGYEFLRKLRALPRAVGGATPAIALTAYARTEDRKRALEAGFNNYLAKPVDGDELVRVVRNLAELIQFDVETTPV